MDSTVVIEPAYNALSDVRALFEAYTAMLVTHDPAFQIYLDIQHYADELRAPAAKYAPPDGRLYLARVDGRAAGCIALRRLDVQTLHHLQTGSAAVLLRLLYKYICKCRNRCPGYRPKMKGPLLASWSVSIP